MVQKHFMDIARIKEEDTDLTSSNTKGFEKGDLIVIQEKVDRANASIHYDENDHQLHAFSRKHELSFDMTLNGFWNYVQQLNSKEYAECPNYVIFGEWLLKNAIRYYPEAYSKWYVYDIFDTMKQVYLSQERVSDFCDKHNLLYVKTFYNGPFISWEHCRGFVGKSEIALDSGEGIVVKNQSKLNSPDAHFPFVLKIVGEHFMEVKKSNHVRKVTDPQRIKEREEAQKIVDRIVTERRVEKELYKMRDEGLIPEKVDPQYMNVVARNLPKRIYEDCIKEEPESVFEAGELFGKLCGSTCMKIAKKVILGSSE